MKQGVYFYYSNLSWLLKESAQIGFSGLLVFYILKEQKKLTFTLGSFLGSITKKYMDD